jgi:exodeoxyribonuclease V gamma subunit
MSKQLTLDFDAPMTAGRIRLITATHIDPLFEDLSARLAADPLPPHQAETICIPHGSGIRTWLEQQLARHLGCSASLLTPSPRELAAGIAREHENEIGAAGTLDPATLAWRIYDFLRRNPSQPEFAPLTVYLERSGASAMRLADRLARVYDGYETYRPDLLAAWSAGENPVPDWGPARWQAPLWKHLTEDHPGAGRSAPERAAEYLGRAETPPAKLPPRLFILGARVIAPVQLDFLRALARHIEVTWYSVLPSASTTDHPLVEVLGGEARMARQLWQGQAMASEEPPGTPVAPSARGTALRVLQDDIRNGTRRSPNDRRTLDATDASIRLHDCHSPMREVEVLRDQLLDAFATIDGLRPSDIIVMLSNVERYASMVDAVFGAGTADSRLPYRLARDGREGGQRYLLTFAALLEALSSRLPAGVILEILAEPAIMQAADLGPTDLEVLREWIRRTHVRWGADAGHKSDFGAPEDGMHSWQFGIDRLMMGLVAGEVDAPISGTLPYAEETLDRADLLGRFALWLQDLLDAVAAVRSDRTALQWSQWLQSLAERFLRPASDDERKAADHLGAMLREMGSAEVYVGGKVPFDAVRNHLADRLARFEGAGRVLTGSITFTDFQRLDHIPARVIACVGLDDESFPARRPNSDFDHLSAEQRPGDPDPRRLDKQLFLDALLAAEDRLIVTWCGRSQKDNTERAPSIVIDALLEACRETFLLPGGDDPANALVVRHPLQPFDARYYNGSDSRLFSFDPSQCVRPPAERAPVRTFAPEALASADDEERIITLRDLIAAWSNPSKFFCERLDVRLKDLAITIEDIEPIHLNHLEQYKPRDRMLDLLLTGRTEDEVHAILMSEGSLPAGALGEAWYRKVREEVEPVLDVVETLGARRPEEVAIEVDGWTVRGRIDGVLGNGSVRFRAGKVRGKDLAAAWIEHLALLAAGIDGPAMVVGTDGMKRLKAGGGYDQALEVLSNLVQGFVASTGNPLVLFPEASYEFAQNLEKKNPWNAALAKFTGKYEAKFSRDMDDPFIAFAFRHRNPIEARDAAFERHAVEFWTPILEALVTP